MHTVRSRDGTTIAYDRAGEGPAIMIGGAFNDRSTAAPLAAELEPHFTVFTYDRRGRGASEDTAPYTVEREVEDLEALIEEAGGSAFVYGLSSGGALALEAAARGLPIARLAVFEPPFIVEGSRPRPPEELTIELGELAASGRRADAVELFITKAVGLPVEAVDQMRTAPMWPGLEAVLADAQHRTLEGQFHDVAPQVLAPELEEFFAVEKTAVEGMKP